MGVKWKYALCAGLMLALFTGCGKGKSEEAENGGERQEKVTLTLASFGKNKELESYVKLFNERQEDIVVEIEEYGLSWLTGEDGIDAVRREIALGKGPDLINYGKEFTGNSLAGNYTVNLLPYLEKDESLKLEDFFGNILEVFYYQGELRAIPIGFSLRTLAGPEERLGGKESWNVEEMMEYYRDREAGMILYPGETKWDVYGTICTGSLEYYIDWEEGKCCFDGQEYRNILEFANLFPDTLDFAPEDSPMRIMREGRALLYPVSLTDVYDICSAEVAFGGREVAYIGYPAEGSGGAAVFPSDIMLAVSEGSGHKEEAWSFIAQLLSEEYQEEKRNEFPIRREALEKQLEEAMEITYLADEEGRQIPEVKSRIQWEGEEAVDIYALSGEEREALMKMITSARMSGARDPFLSEIFAEEIAAYFNGEKSLDETVDIIQSRAAIYVGEKAPKEEKASKEEKAAEEKISEEAGYPRVSAGGEEKTIVIRNPEQRFTAYACAVDGSSVYLSQSGDTGKAAVYSMAAGSDNIEELPVDIPEGMEVNLMAVDPYGKLYLQLSTDRKHRTGGAKVKHLIWRMDGEFQAEKEWDITEAVQEDYPPFCFLVDGQGRFYLQWGYHTVTVRILDGEGSLAQLADCGTLGVDEVNAAGLDAWGSVRLVCRRNGERFAAKLDMQEGTLLEIQEMDFLAEETICLAMGAGTDSGMLLYTDAGEIWALHTEDPARAAEHRGAFSEKGENLAVTVLHRMFLPDGRLFLMETVTENGELAAYQFRYVPTVIGNDKTTRD